MAVQQNKKSRSRRDMRRSHDALTTAAVSVDKASGETHLRHHVTADGYYRGSVRCDGRGHWSPYYYPRISFSVGSRSNALFSAVWR